MIGIASSATPQLDSLLPRALRARRWRSPEDPPAGSPEHGRREKHHPIAGAEHPLATLHPSKSPLMVIATTRQQPPDDSQIPIAPAGGYPPFRLAVSFFGGFRTPAPVPRDGKRPGRAGIRNPSHFLPFIASDRMSAPEAPSRLSEGRAIAPVLPRCCATNYDGRHPALACRYKSLRSSPPCRQHAYSGA